MASPFINGSFNREAMMADVEQEAMDTGGEGEGDLVDRRAHRIMKIFGQITECLEKEKVARMNEMISQIMNLCKNQQEKPVEELNKIYIEYLLIVEFRAGLSVNLIKLSVQSFLMIENDPEVLGNKVKDLFMEMIITEHPTLALDMNLSDELLKTYFSLLNEGSEPALHMRLMIVGMFGVGKTCLKRRLCGRGIEDVESTEVIEIFTETCEVQDDGDWIISPDEERERVFNIRLQNLLERYKKKDVKPNIPDTVYIRAQSSPEQQELDNRMDVTNPPQRTVSFEEFSTRANEIVDDLRQRTVKQDTTNEMKDIRRPTVSIWDFAGQSVYYSTHHFFLNERSIYLLVLDLSKNLYDQVEEDSSEEFLPNFMIGNKTKFTCLEAFKFWIKSIYIYTKQKKLQSNVSNRGEYSPKIVLIGTHKDKITEEKLKGRKLEQYKDDYFEQALKSFEERPMTDLIHRKKFLVNNKFGDMTEFLEIKKEIFKIAKEDTDFLKEAIPAQFIPLERAIFYSKRDKKQIMKFEDLQEENRKLEFPTDSRAIEVFLAFQHAFGNIIYFNTPELHDTVILTPKWIIEAFKAFISHKADKELSDQSKWNDFKERGILREKLIDDLLKSDENLHLVKTQIIHYMEHMDVIVRPVIVQNLTEETRGTDASLQDETDTCRMLENFYIMPCMLPRIPTTNELKSCFKFADGNSFTPTLCMYFKQCFLPPFVIHCILATYVKTMKTKTLGGKQILYNGLGSFSFHDKDDRYLTIWSYEDILHTRIDFLDRVSAKDKREFCELWRTNIEKLVLKIFNFHGKNTYTAENRTDLFEYRIKCSRCKEQMPCEQKVDSDYMCGLFNVNDLQARKCRILDCPSCCETIHAAELLKDWFGVSHGTQEDECTDECLLDSPKEDVIADLSKLIPKKYVKTLGVELCIQEQVIEHLETNRTTSAPCFVYQVLYQWKKRGESLKILYDALPKVGIPFVKEEFFRIIKGHENTDVKEQMDKFLKRLMDTTGNDCKNIVFTDALLAQLAECIGDEFLLLGVRLGVKDRKIQRMLIDYKDDCEKVCRGILKIWRKESTELNVDLLVKAMIKSGTDMTEVFEVLKEHCAV